MGSDGATGRSLALPFDTPVSHRTHDTITPTANHPNRRNATNSMFFLLARSRRNRAFRVTTGHLRRPAAHLGAAVSPERWEQQTDQAPIPHPRPFQLLLQLRHRLLQLPDDLDQPHQFGGVQPSAVLEGREVRARALFPAMPGERASAQRLAPDSRDHARPSGRASTW